MEINPSLARLRILEQQDSVQMQREAAPDGELAGCPGCPYFWTCPVPHRAATVTAHEDIELDEVADQLPERSAYRPRDADDIGWTDTWIDEDDEAEDDDGGDEVDLAADPLPDEPAEDEREDPADGADGKDSDGVGRAPARRGWFRRRRS